MPTQKEFAAIKRANQRLENLKLKAIDMSDEEKAMIFKEATRGADAASLSPEYQSLILQMFLNAVIENGGLTVDEMCQNSNCSPVTYYKLMQGKYGPPVRAWLEGVTKTILSVGVLPLMQQAVKEAQGGSGKHLEIVLDYLGLLDGNEEKGTATIQFVDKFIKSDGGGFTAKKIEAKALPMKKPLPLEPLEDPKQTEQSPGHQELSVQAESGRDLPQPSLPPSLP